MVRLHRNWLLGTVSPSQADARSSLGRRITIFGASCDDSPSREVVVRTSIQRAEANVQDSFERIVLVGDVACGTSARLEASGIPLLVEGSAEGHVLSSTRVQQGFLPTSRT